jgi:hypothetical protein
METNPKETETFKKIDSWLRTIFIVFAVSWFLFTIIYNSRNKSPEWLEDYTNNQFFDGVLVEKHKNKPNGTFFFINIKNAQGEVTEIHISEVKFLDGLEDFYDYIQVGDTLLKQKGSRQIIVKSGARSKIFEAKERESEE